MAETAVAPTDLAAAAARVLGSVREARAVGTAASEADLAVKVVADRTGVELVGSVGWATAAGARRALRAAAKEEVALPVWCVAAVRALVGAASVVAVAVAAPVAAISVAGQRGAAPLAALAASMADQRALGTTAAAPVAALGPEAMAAVGAREAVEE